MIDNKLIIWVRKNSKKEEEIYKKNPPFLIKNY